jgi:hypothetical protein
VGGYAVIGRQSNKAAFEQFWGVTLGPDVVYLVPADSNFVIVNADARQYRLARNGEIDAATIGVIVGKSIERVVPVGPAGSAASWRVVDFGEATPGSGQDDVGVPSPNGCYISEISDAQGGTNAFQNEFIEIHCDGALP